MCSTTGGPLKEKKKKFFDIFQKTFKTEVFRKVNARLAHIFKDSG
jgi:hypothetical protein